MYEQKYHQIDISNHSFLITGGAGFIGSHLVEYLLTYGAGKVRVLDNFSTGYTDNLAPFQTHSALELITGDIRDFETCKSAVQGMDYVSHQAALGSVPRSVHDPLTTNAVNVSGFLNMLCAAKDNHQVKRFVYAASSSTYGDSEELPKVESRIGKPMSPYAVTKYVNELYAEVFAKTYPLQTIGLRYFNVFGPRQSPDGDYAAVVPRFIAAAKANKPPIINGDGEQTRDFTFVENVVQANIKALFTEHEAAINQVYNIACGEQISLNRLWQHIAVLQGTTISPVYGPNRQGDVRHSWADITRVQELLGYQASVAFKEGIGITMNIR